MGGKISVYNLGQLGVDVVKSPVHIDDGAFTKAQNAQVDSTQGVGGIRRRDGMGKLNAVALAGAIRGLIGLPLPDVTALTKHFFIGIDDGGGAATGAWRTSVNGTVWSTTLTSSLPVVPASTSQWSSLFQLVIAPWIPLANRMFYPGNDYTASTTNATLHCFDGTTDFILCRIPPNPFIATQTAIYTILSVIPYSSSEILVTTSDGSSGDRGRVLLIDVTKGLVTQIGAQSDIQGSGFAVPLVACVHQGKVWFSSFNTAGGVASKCYSARVSDATWTHDPNGDSNSGNGRCVGIVSFKGDLYVSTMGDVGSAGLIRKRLSADGSWSTVRTIGSTSLGNYCGPLVVNQAGTTMYFMENLADATGSGTTLANHQRIYSYDGTTFTVEYDVGSNVNNSYFQSGYPCFDSNGDLYWPVIAGTQITQILKRTAAGVWSIADNGAKPLRGALMRVIY